MRRDPLETTPGQPISLICELCLAEVTLPAGHRIEPAPLDASDEALAPPDPSSRWIGMVRGTDSAFLPVALTRTLASCWDALMHYPSDGDRLCTPTMYTTGDYLR